MGIGTIPELSDNQVQALFGLHRTTMMVAAILATSFSSPFDIIIPSASQPIMFLP